MNNYYTYAYLRDDGTPYYIGKGKKHRAYETHRHIKVPKDKNRILFLKQNLTEDESFKHEKYMINVLGRKDLGTGILRNRTNGGDGASGFTHSEETKKKLRGRILSEETRKRMSEAKLGKTLSEDHKKRISESNKGEKNHFYGKIHSEETKKKIGESSKGRKHSDETKRKLSEVNKGKIVSDKIKNIKK